MPRSSSIRVLRDSAHAASGTEGSSRAPASTKALRSRVQNRSRSAFAPARLSQTTPPDRSALAAQVATLIVLPAPLGAMTTVSRPETPTSSRSETVCLVTTQSGTAGRLTRRVTGEPGLFDDAVTN